MKQKLEGMTETVVGNYLHRSECIYWFLLIPSCVFRSTN